MLQSGDVIYDNSKESAGEGAEIDLQTLRQHATTTVNNALTVPNPPLGPSVQHL